MNLFELHVAERFLIRETVDLTAEGLSSSAASGGSGFSSGGGAGSDNHTSSAGSGVSSGGSGGAGETSGAQGNGAKAGSNGTGYHEPDGSDGVNAGADLLPLLVPIKHSEVALQRYGPRSQALLTSPSPSISPSLFSSP